MVRNYVRKTDRETPSEEIMRMAVNRVLMTKQSARSVAKDFKISAVTLNRVLKKHRESGLTTEASFVPNYSIRQVFNYHQEALLKDYLTTLSRIHQGLTVKRTTEIAYQLATVEKLRIPASWEKNKAAGVDWYFGFRKRHPELAIWSTERSAKSAATAVDKTDGNEFYADLEKVYSEIDPSELYPGMIYAMGVKVLASFNASLVLEQKGKKKPEQLTSGERRAEVVTVCCVANAAGCSVPPYLVFPGDFTENLLVGAPPGSGGSASQSGWMTEDTFLLALEHFQKCVRCSRKNRTILILDDSHSHVTLRTLTFCKDNGIVLVALPQGSSSKLHPLDLTIFESLKNRYNTLCNEYLLANPSESVTVEKVASLFGKAYILAFVLCDIIKGFEVTGIFPPAHKVLEEYDSSSSICTDDRLAPLLCEELPSTSGCSGSPTSPEATIADVASLEDFRTFPGTEILESTSRRKGKRKSSPVKIAVERDDSKVHEDKFKDSSEDLEATPLLGKSNRRVVPREDRIAGEALGDYVLSQVLGTAVIPDEPTQNECFKEIFANLEIKYKSVELQTIAEGTR